MKRITSGMKTYSEQNSSVKKTKQNALMLLSNCALCEEKNQLSLKKENSKILMVSLKLIKLLINFY